MKIYTLKTQLQVNTSLENCWTFFSSPENLQKITPESMGFQITNFDKKPMYAGQIIQYKVSPLFGIKLKWVTEITVVEKNKHFIDNQIFGPYTLWHHKHFFEENDNGVLMTDLVHYALPLGILGRLMNFLIVKKQLKTIFDYRTQKINELFPLK